MTRLIIVRHAQSIANREQVFIGHRNLDLTETGREQARLLGEYLVKKAYPIDTIYSSDLLRPFHTVEPYADAVGKEIIKEKGLREIYAGEWEGHKFTDLPILYPENFYVWLNDIGNCQTNGGESVKELYNRINSTVDRIAEENDGKTVLIGTHATPLRCLCARVRGVGTDGMMDIKWCENTALNIFEYSAGVLSAVELNICEHLGALRTELPSTV